MPFIGNQPSNNFVSLKRQDITGDGTASYTLDHKVASVNDILVYVNHVKQDPSSMTVSGTSLTMGGNVSSSDDFYVIFLGQALQTVTPADNTITNAMLSETITVANGGTGITSGFKNGVTLAQQWRLTATTNLSVNAVVSSNWEHNDSDGYAKIGSLLTEASGVFTLPETGLYLINLVANFQSASGDTALGMLIEITEDNSTFNERGDARDGGENNGAGNRGGSTSFIFNVTDTTTHKFRFSTTTFNTGSALFGNTTSNKTHFTILKLGDSV